MSNSTKTYQKLIQPQITGPVLYPMSGADISCLLLFPNAKTIVMIDGQLLLNVEDEEKLMSKSNFSAGHVLEDVNEVYDQNVIDRIKKGFKNQKMPDPDVIPLSFPMFLAGNTSNIEHDFTSIWYILARTDLLPYDHPYVYDSKSKGIIHIMISRIRDHTPYDVKNIVVVVPKKVYKFNLFMRDSPTETRTIYYVCEMITKGKLGQRDPLSNGIQWIDSQQFEFETLLIKGNPYYKNYDHNNDTTLREGAEIKSVIQHLCLNSGLKNIDSFRFFTDQARKGGAFASVSSRPISMNHGTPFGYDTLFVCYDYNSLL